MFLEVLFFVVGGMGSILSMIVFEMDDYYYEYEIYEMLLVEVNFLIMLFVV